MKKDFKISIVDDHEIVRDGMSHRLKRLSFISSIVSYSNCEDALRGLDDHPNQIVTLDVLIPGRCPYDAADTIKRRWPETKVLFFTAFPTHSSVARAVDVKADGFVTKGENSEELVRAIKLLREDRPFYSKGVRKILATLNPEKKTGTKLTLRQLEFVGYIAKGMSTSEIAKTMHISPKTVARHKENITRKLGVYSSVDIARFAYREKIASYK